MERETIVRPAPRVQFTAAAIAAALALATLALFAVAPPLVEAVAVIAMLALAMFLALLAWRRKESTATNRVTVRDVAGILALIGFSAALLAQ